MFKKVIISVSLLLVTLSCFAKQNISNGLLQAYWLPVWDKSGTVNTPQLEFRYFSLNEQNELQDIISLRKLGQKEERRSFLTRNFKKIPESFLKYKEGHIEQFGSIIVNNLKVTKECDRKISYGELQSFVPKKTRKAIDIKALEESAGCGGYPYKLTYTLKATSSPSYFSLSPDSDSERGAFIPADKHLITINRVNECWIFAGIYDESKPGLAGDPQGYINLDKLTPVN